MSDARGTRTAAEGYGIVAIAASAGGISALEVVLGQLPADIPVPVVVVQHLDRHRETQIAKVLSRGTALAVKLAEEGERPRPAVVYIAPPDRHLVIGGDGAFILSAAEPQHFVRPSADVLFESVARTYGAATLACVLTGTGRDGAAGVEAICRAGGAVIVQDPRTAKFDGMPQAALDACPGARALPLEAVGAAILDLLGVSKP